MKLLLSLFALAYSQLPPPPPSGGSSGTSTGTNTGTGTSSGTSSATSTGTSTGTGTSTSISTGTETSSGSGTGTNTGTGTGTNTIAPPVTTTPLPVKLNWGGQSLTDPCGSMVEIKENLVNTTCTITYNFGPVPNLYRMFIGSGAFIVPDGVDRKITGYDGISTETKVDIVAFWQMTEDANQNLINDTCGDAAFFDLDCEPTLDGNALPGVFFMETINDPRMGKGSQYGFQIGGAAVGQTLNIQLKDALGNPFECNNFNSNAGDVQLSTAPNCSPVLMPDGITPIFPTEIYCANGAISLDLSDNSSKVFSGGLVTFSCTQSMTQATEPDLWQSTISV